MIFVLRILLCIDNFDLKHKYTINLLRETVVWNEFYTVFYNETYSICESETMLSDGSWD